MSKYLHLTATTNANRVRAFCIKHDYYTDGNNDQYRNLLTYVDQHKKLDRYALETIAGNIVGHSVLDYSVDPTENVNAADYMAELILNECCWISYEVDE